MNPNFRFTLFSFGPLLIGKYLLPIDLLQQETGIGTTEATAQ